MKNVFDKIKVNAIKKKDLKTNTNSGLNGKDNLNSVETKSDSKTVSESLNSEFLKAFSRIRCP